MPGRRYLIRLLRKHFATLIDPNIEKHYQLKLRPPGSPPIVLADRRAQRCSAALWLEQLSYADFFLALPGSYFPMAHNVIESMAVGTIPILSYDHYFHPKLEDGENCLTYADGKSFVMAVQRALSMSTEEKSRLRQNVIAYYEQSIEFKTRAQKLLDDPAKSKQLYFPYEYRLQPGWANAIDH
jgi:glycosyltransferase involved in cell wall biosynthesis